MREVGRFCVVTLEGELLLLIEKNTWLLFSLGSNVKLYIRIESSISLFTENGTLNATETAVCNFLSFIGAQNVVHSPVIVSVKY